MITKTVIVPAVLHGKRSIVEGFCFRVYFDNREYPNVISRLSKTKLGCQRDLNRYLRTGKLKYYSHFEK